jgi:hypothetical protein
MGIELSARTVGQSWKPNRNEGRTGGLRRASARGRGDETGGRCLVALAVLAGRVVSNRQHHSCPCPSKRSCFHAAGRDQRYHQISFSHCKVF